MGFVNVEENVYWNRDSKKIPSYAKDIGKLVSENINGYDPILITLKNHSSDNNSVTVAQMVISGAQIFPDDSVLRQLEEDKNFIRFSLTNSRHGSPAFGKILGMVKTPYRAGNDEIGFIHNDPYHKECHLDTPLIKHELIGAFSSSLSKLKKITATLAKESLLAYENEENHL